MLCSQTQEFLLSTAPISPAQWQASAAPAPRPAAQAPAPGFERYRFAVLSGGLETPLPQRRARVLNQPLIQPWPIFDFSLSCSQNKLQMLASFFSSPLLFMTQYVLHEWRLARKWTMTTTKGIQKRVPVVNEERGPRHWLLV